MMVLEPRSYKFWKKALFYAGIGVIILLVITVDVKEVLENPEAVLIVLALFILMFVIIPLNLGKEKKLVTINGHILIHEDLRRGETLEFDLKDLKSWNSIEDYGSGYSTAGVILHFNNDQSIGLSDSELTNIFSFKVLLEQRYASKNYETIQKRRRKEAKDAYEKGNKK